MIAFECLVLPASPPPLVRVSVALLWLAAAAFPGQSMQAGGLFLSKYLFRLKLLSGLRSYRAYHESGRDSVAFW